MVILQLNLSRCLIIFVALNEVTLCTHSLIFSSLNIIVQTVEKVKFNALEISHFLVNVWRRNIALLA